MAETTPTPQVEADTSQLIASLWQRLLPQTTERLALLDHAAAAATTGTLTPALHAEASAIAHKFAGSLGMFGFHEGTRLAAELEHHLDSPHPDPVALATLTHQLRRSLPDLSAS